MENLDKTYEQLMGSEGKKFLNKKNELEALAGSPEGKEVKQMLQKGGIEEALNSGDTKKVQETIAQILSTESGSKLVSQLKSLMDK